MSIGDVHSDARGSGARFNDGKPPLQLIPLERIADSLCDFQLTSVGSDTACALAELGEFQTTHSTSALDRAISNLRRYWRDCAAVFEYGRKKYAEWNWAKGMPWSVPLACGARHALAILEGEEIDRESGFRHVGHFQCNLVMLRTYVDSYPEGNDLPPASLFSRIPPPNYDPASVAFRHGDTVTFDRAPAADQPVPSGWGWLGEADSICVTFPNGDFHVVRQKTAAELAAADGCIEYGNPITPDCAPWRLP